jgi:hypothetical protein
VSAPDGDLDALYEDRNGAPYGTEQDTETDSSSEMEEVECSECGASLAESDEECDACGAAQ